MFRKAPHAIGDRQPDHDHVYNQPKEHIMKLIRASIVKRRERQNDITHRQFHRDAIEQAADQRVLYHKVQFAARSIKDGRRGESDKEVQDDAQEVRRCASLERLPPQQARGNRQRNSPPKEDQGLRKVQSPRESTAYADGQQCVAFPNYSR